MVYVLPIFKKGSRNKADNYRPISLTSIMCKLMESFVKDSIMTHMRAENLLSSKQYRFINGRSTMTQLLSILISALIPQCLEDLWIQYISILSKHSIVLLMKDCSVNSNRTVSVVRSCSGEKLS